MRGLTSGPVNTHIDQVFANPDWYTHKVIEEEIWEGNKADR